MTNLSDKPRRKSGFHAEQMGEEVVLYHPAGSQILQMNPSAFTIWQLCDGQRTIAEMIELIQQAYPEAASQIAHDVTETLRQWESAGCIEPV